MSDASLMQRWANISEAKNAKRLRNISKPKTWTDEISRMLKTSKQKLEKKGFSTTIFALKEISPRALMQFPTDKCLCKHCLS